MCVSFCARSCGAMAKRDFPMPGSRQQYNLPVAALGSLPSAQQQLDLLLAPDEQG